MPRLQVPKPRLRPPHMSDLIGLRSTSSILIRGLAGLYWRNVLIRVSSIYHHSVQADASGYADDSCWSRGQAWGVYGYAQCGQYFPIYFLRALIRQLYVLAERTSWKSHEILPISSSPSWDLLVFQNGTSTHPNHVHTTLQPLQSPLEVCRCCISYYYPPIKLRQSTT
jgi:hypothetical protein